MRLIDADALKEAMNYNGACGICFRYVDDADTIDAVPVVRCRNCRHYNTACCNEGCGWCEDRNVGTWDEWFCADGEAKTNAYQEARKDI